MNYIFYDEITGKVLQGYTGNDPELQLSNFPPSTRVMEGVVTKMSYISNGEVVEVEPPPSHLHVYNWENKSWETPVGFIDLAKKDALRRVNAISGEVILNRLPLWKQQNMTARAVELQAIGSANWSAVEQQEWDSLQEAWNWVKSVRAASNVATGAIDQATQESEIEAAKQSFDQALLALNGI